MGDLKCEKLKLKEKEKMKQDQVSEGLWNRIGEFDTNDSGTQKDHG